MINYLISISYHNALWLVFFCESINRVASAIQRCFFSSTSGVLMFSHLGPLLSPALHCLHALSLGSVYTNTPRTIATSGFLVLLLPTFCC